MGNQSCGLQLKDQQLGLPCRFAALCRKRERLLGGGTPGICLFEAVRGRGNAGGKQLVEDGCSWFVWWTREKWKLKCT